MPEVNKESSAYQQAIKEVRAEAKKRRWDAKAAIVKMAEIERRKLEVDDLYQRINGEYDTLRKELIPALMEEEGLDNITITGVGRVSLTADIEVSTKGGAKDSLFDWLRVHDLDDVIQDNINASTLKALVKKRMKEGKPIPDEFLNIHPFTRASITKK